MSLRQWLDQARSLLQSLQTSRVKLVLTVSIGAIGVTAFAANYYFKILSRKNKKRILNKSRHLLQMIPELKASNVRIKNPNHVELVLSNLIHSGKQRLQVISDFDRTISLNSYQGQNCLTSHSVIEKSRFTSPEIRQKFDELRHQYMPIEHDHSLTKDEKIPYMIEWWNKSFDLLIQSGLKRENLIEIVRNSVIHLKDGCQWFFYTLERYDVPLLIFSAGLGDVIQEWITQQCGSFKNMKIVSNFMSFDLETNKISGFQGNMIHVFNKNEGVLLDTEFEKQIESRTNVILLGDSPGDVDMAVGFPNLKNILKIGFLYGNIEQLLPLYMDIYDIVAINDSTFNVPNAILRSII